jgi:murein L,D-transpeptidase YcbB/YkuD
MKKPIWIKLAVFAFAFSVLTGCGSQEPGNVAEEPNNKIDSNQSITVNVNGKIFSIPSPIQTALLIKKSGAGYNKEMLNPHNKANNYSTNFSKALNLGVYGADLGYITLYDQTQDALGYFKSVQKLADELGMSAAFNKNLMERFNSNLGKKDSMLYLVAGGWIEALHFATNIVKQKNNDEVIRRIAEQKTSLDNLIGLLESSNNNNESTDLINGLKGLKADFDAIEYKYFYEKPVTDAAKKVTVINSRTEVNITPQQLDSITKKVSDLRKLIVG